MLVKEIMTKPVITIEYDKTIFDACEKYREYKIGCLIITKNSECVGIVTERDIIERTICKKIDPNKTQIKDIMTFDIETVHELNTVEDVIKIMKEKNIKKLPVIKNDDIVGIITVTDITRAKPEFSKRFINSWVKPEWED